MRIRHKSRKNRKKRNKSKTIEEFVKFHEELSNEYSNEFREAVRNGMKKKRNINSSSSLVDEPLNTFIFSPKPSAYFLEGKEIHIPFQIRYLNEIKEFFGLKFPILEDFEKDLFCDDDDDEEEEEKEEMEDEESDESDEDNEEKEGKNARKNLRKEYLEMRSTLLKLEFEKSLCEKILGKDYKNKKFEKRKTVDIWRIKVVFNCHYYYQNYNNDRVQENQEDSGFSEGIDEDFKDIEEVNKRYYVLKEWIDVCRDIFKRSKLRLVIDNVFVFAETAKRPKLLQDLIIQRYNVLCYPVDVLTERNEMCEERDENLYEMVFSQIPLWMVHELRKIRYLGFERIMCCAKMMMLGDKRRKMIKPKKAQFFKGLYEFFAKVYSFIVKSVQSKRFNTSFSGFKVAKSDLLKNMNARFIKRVLLDTFKLLRKNERLRKSGREFSYDRSHNEIGNLMLNHKREFDYQLFLEDYFGNHENKNFAKFVEKIKENEVDAFNFMVTDLYNMMKSLFDDLVGKEGTKDRIVSIYKYLNTFNIAAVSKIDHKKIENLESSTIFNILQSRDFMNRSKGKFSFNQVYRMFVDGSTSDSRSDEYVNTKIDTIEVIQSCEKTAVRYNPPSPFLFDSKERKKLLEQEDKN